MPNYTIQQRVKMIEFYFSNGHSVVQTQRQYRSYFDVPDAPSRVTVQKLVTRFQTTGTVHDITGTRTGRPKTSCTPEQIENVRKSILAHPNLSVRKRASELGVSRSSLRRIILKIDSLPKIVPETTQEQQNVQPEQQPYMPPPPERGHEFEQLFFNRLQEAPQTVPTTEESPLGNVMMQLPMMNT